MTRRMKTGTLVLVGLGLALALAFLVAPEASSKPDGLEKVAGDEGFLDGAQDHDLAGSPTADYGVEGVDNSRLSTGLAGALGIAVTFAAGGGLLFLVRRSRGEDDGSAPVAPGTAA